MPEILRQLQAVGDLQRHLLPRTVPELPGWRLAVHYTVGRWPGGDYYDFLLLPDGRLLLLAADASDQGAPSAALVAMVRVLLHSCPLSSGTERLPFCPFREPLVQPPHLILGHLNRVLFENSLPGQFMTAFCGVLDPVDGNLHYANAAYPAPLCWRAARRCFEPLWEATGLPLGMEPQVSYHHKRVEIEPGDMLVLYSDGLTAGPNDRGQVFGCAQLDEVLCHSVDGGAEAAKAAVKAWLEVFLDGQRPEDDVVLLLIERLSEEE